MDNIIVYLIIAVIAFFIGVFITRWIFEIEKIISNLTQQTDILSRQTEILKQNAVLLEYQSEAMITQIHLLASLAEKAGVPIEDINAVTKVYDIEFVE